MTATEPTTAIVPFKPQAISFPVPADKIAKWAAEYLPLKVKGIEDKMGLATVHRARMELKEARVLVEKRRKELKADALRYGKEVDSAAKALFDAMEPIEKHLHDQETVVEREKKRIAAEEEARKKAAWEAKMQGRIDALAKCNVHLLTSKLEALTDAEYEKLLADEQTKFAAAQEELRRAESERKAEEERLAKERAELERQKAEQEQAAAEQRRIEEEKLAAERAELEKRRQEQAARDRAEREELDRQRKEQEAREAAERQKLEAQRQQQEQERQELEAEKRRIEAEEAEREKQAAIEKARREAAEEARLAAIEEEKRKEREAKEVAEELKRIEALKPDRAKLLELAAKVGNIVVPQLSEAGESYTERASQIIHQADLDLRSLAGELVPKENGKAKRKAELAAV